MTVRTPIFKEPIFVLCHIQLRGILLVLEVQIFAPDLHCQPRISAYSISTLPKQLLWDSVDCKHRDKARGTGDKIFLTERMLLWNELGEFPWRVRHWKIPFFSYDWHG